MKNVHPMLWGLEGTLQPWSSTSNGACSVKGGWRVAALCAVEAHLGNLGGSPSLDCCGLFRVWCSINFLK